MSKSNRAQSRRNRRPATAGKLGNCLDAFMAEEPLATSRDRARFNLSDRPAEFYKKRSFVPKSFGREELGIGREKAQEAQR